MFVSDDNDNDDKDCLQADHSLGGVYKKRAEK